MVEITIQDKKYNIPTEWKDMSVKYWCNVYNVINKYQKRDEEGNIIDEPMSEVEMLRLNRDIFLCITGLGKDFFEKLDITSVTNAVNAFSSTLEDYKPKGIKKFTFEDEEYFFPSDYLKRNTFGDYIEATHLDTTIEMMKHGKFDVLPEQMAILCRKIGEKYDDDIIPEKTEKFKNLTMDIVWEFAFFLTQQSITLSKTFQTFLGKTEEEVEQAKVEFLQLDSTTNL